jgi:hypothetical protein
MRHPTPPLAGRTHDIPQAVFDSRDARNIARRGTDAATQALQCTPRESLGDGNPNHPRYNGACTPRQAAGRRGDAAQCRIAQECA